MALLEVENLTVLSPRRREPFRNSLPEGPVALLDSVSFAIPPGQTLGIVGEKDGGTLPLAFALSGLSPISSGRIVFQDQELNGMRARQRQVIRRQMPILFSDGFDSLPPKTTVSRMLIAAHANGGGSKDKAERLREIERAMDRAGLAFSTREKTRESLTAAERQRVSLTRALLQHPRLLILHEFTRGLDPAAQAELVNHLTDLQQDLGLAYLVLTGDLALAVHLAPELLILNRGKVVDAGPRDEIIANPQHEFTKRLLQISATSHV